MEKIVKEEVVDYLRIPRRNVAIQKLAFLSRIPKFLCSNLGLETGYPDWDFSYFYSVLSGKFQDRDST